MTKRAYIVSKRPCPVCGGRRWRPIEIFFPLSKDGEEVGVFHVPAEGAVVDLVRGWQGFHDECLRCKTVVHG